MMGHRERYKGGIEDNALSGWRRLMSFRPGTRRFAKRKVSRRNRWQARQELRRHE